GDQAIQTCFQWATKQVPELQLGTNPDNWSSDDINTIKDTISDCMPYVRFFDMSPKKIVSFVDLLPKALRSDILNRHMDKDYEPNVCILPPRIGQQYGDSLIITK